MSTVRSGFGRLMAGFLALSAVAHGGCKLSSLTQDQIGAITSSVQSVSKAARPLGEDEEYYVGRAVAARLTSTYPLYRNSRLTQYVNQIGLTLALHTERPTTFGGYHFAVLDTPQLNAFACPGGTILVTRGMISSLQSEDELAAVLAHEIGHVIHRDGTAAIQSSRWSEALLVIGNNAAREFGPKDTAKLVSLFEGSIDDVVKTLLVNGYGREQERDADAAAQTYLAAAGYDPQGLTGYLKRLELAGKGSKGGILTTHPGTAERLENLGQLSAGPVDRQAIALRTKRFNEIVR
jgi:predicted Zn-dependent protease